jgi:hypothetical protein
VICQIFVNNHLSVSRQKSTFWGEIMWNHCVKARRHGIPELTTKEFGAWCMIITFVRTKKWG